MYLKEFTVFFLVNFALGQSCRKELFASNVMNSRPKDMSGKANYCMIDIFSTCCTE